MSLNLRINRPKPRRFRYRQILWLVIAVLASITVLSWQTGFRPDTSQLARFNQKNLLPLVPVAVAETLPQPIQEAVQPQSDVVVMVASEVIENPHSDAFTADLYSATGKDDIPWPNVDGRTRVETYVVQDGDSLWGISNQFGVDIDTLRWANPALERNPDELAVGQELNILPVDGVYHFVEAGDTIETIAALYGVAPDEISHYPPNALFPPYELEAGDAIIVPFGQRGRTLPAPTASWDSALAWPIVGTVSGTFDATHEAMDIGAPYGSIVYAADGGTITYSGWAADGYGYTVIIDHGNGRETWYNHLKGALLDAGGYVERGTPIGEVGSTGHSTGPHVHFELRLNGQRVDPADYLPAGNPQ